MYKLDTYIKEDRIPYMVKTEICNEKITVNTPKKVFNMLNTYFNLGLRSEEYVYMISMYAKCNIIGIFEISHGIINQSMLNPREIFMKALLSGAASIILAHNHPSGNCSPSQEDRNCCNRIHEVGEMLGIELSDFLVVSEKTYCSFKEKAYLRGKKI